MPAVAEKLTAMRLSSCTVHRFWLAAPGSGLNTVKRTTL
jgi:hypothetical protein